MRKWFKVSIKVKALVFLAIYIIFAKILYFYFVANFSLVASYIVIGLFSCLFGVVYLYLFSHEDFFRFAKLIELKERKQEEWWLHFFTHTGKFVTATIIGVLLGPILAALSVRILYPRFAYKYWLVIFICALSDIFWVSFGKGVFEVLF